MAKDIAQPGRWIVTTFGPPSVLSWKAFDPLPVPLQNEARVRIIATGVGAVDNIQRSGGYPDERTISPGFTPGYEFVGEVDAVGPGVSSVNVGDHVAALCTVGAYATHIVLPAMELFPIHPSDDAVKVAALPLNFMTAYGLLKRSGVNLPRGSSVLIGSAAGGIGSAIAQLNTALDMGLVLLGTCSPRNFSFVKALGITPIDRHAADLPARVKELTGGRGVNVAFDAVGSEESIRTSFECTAEGTGEVRVIGVQSSILSGGAGMSPERFKTFEMLEKGVIPRTKFWMVTVDYYHQDRETFAKDFESLLQAVRDGRLSPLIGKLFRLDQSIEANELLAHGAPFEGKMEFLVDEDLAKSRGL
jgi:NADPH:quinone reductase-like Zn-dependent oxidoreductase